MLRRIRLHGLGIAATPSSPEKGKTILDMLTDYTKSFLQDFRKLPLSQKEK